MKKFIRIAADLGKNYFQVHALENEGGGAMIRKLSRAKFREFFSRIAPCRVGMEACGSAHCWARELIAMGHEAVLMPPAYTKPYVKRGPRTMRPTRRRSSRGDVATGHEIRAGQERGKPSRADAAQDARVAGQAARHERQRGSRGHLAEFGLVVAKGIGRVDELLALAQVDAGLPPIAKAAVARMAQHLAGIGQSIDAVEDDIAKAHGQNQTSRLLDEIPGVGMLIASAIAASVPDASVFKPGRDFAAWLGLTPKQNSSGGKTLRRAQELGAIAKQGNRYIRKMLVVGATSVPRVARKRKGALAEWIVAPRARKPDKVAAAALANKLARTGWAIMTTGESFRRETYVKA